MHWSAKSADTGGRHGCCARSCGVVALGATKATDTTLRCQSLEFYSADDQKLITLQADDFLGLNSLSFMDSDGTEFFYVMPGILRLDYPADKGGGSFIWAGPELDGNGVVQIIGKERNKEGNYKSVIEMGADSRGNGQISLRKRLSDDWLLFLGADHAGDGGAVEFYGSEGHAGAITSSMFQK